MLTNHLADMRRFMPVDHRAVIEQVEALPDIRAVVAKEPFNDRASMPWRPFAKRTSSLPSATSPPTSATPAGTGGTPYMNWLSQLIDETRGHKIA